MRNIELISMAELREIRRILVFEKHEFEKYLPQIYVEATGEKFPGLSPDEPLVLGAEEIGRLKEACEDDLRRALALLPCRPLPPLRQHPPTW
ncbi:hypothetical protein R2B67_09075 [Streptomyces cyaneofuscatus]|uniref:hypothetical protein n=1 Tax=Streptomyces cyaneofuscatus TaxID=66883 RepID=UPI0029548A17|nr:hypothetical protein [Streptomyces cyaneofuscatus]WOP08700.1 hypothetical protein R2B67_09075 [Streptomyces cyaneofuscatus]